MFYRLRKIYRPEIFQGGLQKRNYFEGWYFKIIDRNAAKIYAVIPGVSISGIKSNSHSFIQVMDGTNATSQYFRFDFKDFNYSGRQFNASIGNNFFSADKMHLDISQGGQKIKADLKFHNTHPWPKSPFAPGAMGWYAFVPFMECYHGVVSMSHNIKGSADFGRGYTDFTGGKGYIEKDWGKSFPAGWIWLQSNHFKNAGTSLMLSVARIPWLKKTFTGFICGLLLNENIHIFATYNGSKIKQLDFSANEFCCIIQRGSSRLKISASRKESAELASPLMGAMDGRINESIDAKVEIEYIGGKKDNKQKTELYRDSGFAAGLEIVNPEVLK